MTIKLQNALLSVINSFLECNAHIMFQRWVKQIQYPKPVYYMLIYTQRNKIRKKLCNLFITRGSCGMSALSNIEEHL